MREPLDLQERSLHHPRDRLWVSADFGIRRPECHGLYSTDLAAQLCTVSQHGSPHKLSHVCQHLANWLFEFAVCYLAFNQLLVEEHAGLLKHRYCIKDSSMPSWIVVVQEHVQKVTAVHLKVGERIQELFLAGEKLDNLTTTIICWPNSSNGRFPLAGYCHISRVVTSSSLFSFFRPEGTAIVFAVAQPGTPRSIWGRVDCAIQVRKRRGTANAITDAPRPLSSIEVHEDVFGSLLPRRLSVAFIGLPLVLAIDLIHRQVLFPAVHNYVWLHL